MSRGEEGRGRKLTSMEKGLRWTERRAGEEEGEEGTDR